jgi:LysR family transcriptional regulator, glycine cleavage system transcriptional activator
MPRLPPFFALRALAIAARRRSYSRAAEELSVTHGAVSQQIRKLEEELGARLFARKGNAMIPTPEAERLASEIDRAMQILQVAVDDFSQAAERDPLVVSLDPQFAARWLPPRLPRLTSDPAGANLDLVVESRLANFVTDGVDMGVRYGPGPAPGVETVLLLREQLFPVASPELAAKYDFRSPADLLAAPLLRHRHRAWDLWFSAFGLTDPGKGMEFEDSIMLVDSAALGMGVALGRSSLIEQDLASGRLVRLLPHAVDNDYATYLAWRPDNPKLRRIHALRDWLLAEAAAPPP